MPIQGTSADIIKIALARLQTALRRFSGAELVNAVHDEVVVECDAYEAPAVARVVKAEMEAAGADVLRNVPLLADVVIREYWEK